MPDMYLRAGFGDQSLRWHPVPLRYVVVAGYRFTIRIRLIEHPSAIRTEPRAEREVLRLAGLCLVLVPLT
jgi:hypothetical protein